MNSIEELVNSVDLEGAEHEHDWWVFSTALMDVVIMCQCHTCGAGGIIREHSIEEWGAAYYAPSKPYKWHDNERVEVVHTPNAIDGDDWIPLA